MVFFLQIHLTKQYLNPVLICIVFISFYHTFTSLLLSLSALHFCYKLTINTHIINDSLPVNGIYNIIPYYIIPYYTSQLFRLSLWLVVK